MNKMNNGPELSTTNYAEAWVAAGSLAALAVLAAGWGWASTESGEKIPVNPANNNYVNQYNGPQPGVTLNPDSHRPFSGMTVTVPR